MHYNNYTNTYYSHHWNHDFTPKRTHRSASVEAVQAARRQTAAHAEIGALLDAWGDDPYDDGAVITFDVQFKDGGTTYSYVFLRADGDWYGTSTAHSCGVTWDDLVAFAVKHNVAPSDRFEVATWKRA